MSKPKTPEEGDSLFTPTLPLNKSLRIKRLFSYLDVGNSTGYKEVSSGRLETYKVGRSRFGTLEKAEKWRQERIKETAIAEGRAQKTSADSSAVDIPDIKNTEDANGENH
ncbi:MAG: hypothetical protein ABJA67_07150 [Chthonomonadales bacterium]